MVERTSVRANGEFDFARMPPPRSIPKYVEALHNRGCRFISKNDGVAAADVRKAVEIDEIANLAVALLG